MREFEALSAALKTALRAHNFALRGTGRTTEIIMNMMDGDYFIVCGQDLRRSHIQPLLSKLGREHVTVINDSAKDLNTLADRLRGIKPGTNIHFDHEWVEAYFWNSLEQSLQQMASFHKHFVRPAPNNDPKTSPELAGLRKELERANIQRETADRIVRATLDEILKLRRQTGE